MSIDTLYDDHVAQPAAKVEIYWSDVTGWVDETSRLSSGGLRIDRSLQNPLRSLGRLGQAPIGTASIEVQNADGRYSAAKPGSQANIYGIFNKKIRISLGYSSDLTVAFVGRITGVRESETSVEATLVCRDLGEDVARQAVRTSLATQQTTRDWIETLLNAAGYTPGAGDLEKSHCVIPYAYAEKDNAWDELNQAAASEAGVLFTDKSGGIRFWAYTHWLTESVVYSWDGDFYQELVPERDYFSTYNVVTVEYEPRQEAAAAVVYQLHRALHIPPGESRSETLTFRFPLTEFTGYEMAAVTGGGEDISADVSISPGSPASAQTWEIEFTNNNTRHEAFITKFNVTGRALVGRPSESYTADPDDVSGSADAKELSTRGNWYVQTPEQARLLADLIQYRLSRPPMVLRLRGLPCNPNLELGDKISVSGAQTGVNTTAVVIGISISGMVPLVMDVTAVDYSYFYEHADSEYFLIGTSHLSAADGGRCVY